MIIKFLQSPNADMERIGSRSLSSSSCLNMAESEFIETSSKRESNIIFAAYLNKRDFRLARFAIPEMRAFHDYQDWLDFRQGSLWGLEMAGFQVEIIRVSWSMFEMWRSSTSTPPDISALDQFARIRADRIGSKQFGSTHSKTD
jgi:hypothetical protein